jgi:hypothetical protein
MGTCQSCGRDGEEVAAVQRVYLLSPEAEVAGEDPAAGAEAPSERIRVEDEVEYWCWSCREHFPHVPLDPGSTDRAGTD